MSATDKLQVIEEIWADLSMVSEDVPSPAWHADVLRAREERISDGRSRFLDIAQAKAVVRLDTKICEFISAQTLSCRAFPGLCVFQ